MNDVYVKILKDLADEIIGEDLVKVESNDDSTRIRISINPKDSCGYSCYTIYTENGYYILNELNFNSLEFFKEYAKQILEISCKNAINYLFKKGIIKESSHIKPDIINLDKITEKWFINKFEEITDEKGNDETVEDLIITKSDDSVDISFSVDSGRYRIDYDNSIIVTSKGDIEMDLSEIIKGGCFEGELKRSIEYLIKS